MELRYYTSEMHVWELNLKWVHKMVIESPEIRNMIIRMTLGTIFEKTNQHPKVMTSAAGFFWDHQE